MLKTLSNLVKENEVQDFRMFLYELWHGEKKYLLNNDIMLALEDFCHNNERDGLLSNSSSVYKLLKHTPEIIISEDVVILIHRYQMSRYRYYKISIHMEDVDEISVRELLDIRDRHARPDLYGQDGKLRIDFLPFYDYGPNIKDARRIGKGIEFLNKYMSSNLFQNPDKWNRFLYEFLKIHSFGDRQLLINGELVKNVDQLSNSLESALSDLESANPKDSYDDVAPTLKHHGLEAGWGDTVARIQETMHLLLELFQSPDSSNLERFISRIPMISNIAIISPHGWFGQENVLGRPDTGGQIVYILDQVRALEQTMNERIKSYGLNIMPKIVVVTRLIPDSQGTTCGMRREKIHHTENAYILRVPFHDKQGNIIPHWISRFEVWPYLERFAYETKRELISEFNGSPDLVIGNYSDGNLVATLLADEFDVTQCNIAHALEKNKYLFSDLYWFNFEDQYHFSIQHIVDLISMNMADFIITSTFQEIAGSKDSIGQYESYLSFTMPGLLQVENGINLFHPKFNVIPPGVDEKIYFPYTEEDRRLQNQKEHLKELLFTAEQDSIVGHLDNPEKPPIFTMARLDHNKNITGLVESFGQSPELQEKCNLIAVAGNVDPGHASDKEEVSEIHRMHGLIEQYNLQGKIRWLGIHLPKEDSGEVYRIIADHGGVFVQPGRFEGFGLTVLEAMYSGLPTFATQFGGPAEIIIDGESGFLINPTMPELISTPLLEFYAKVEKSQQHWHTYSKAGIKRVKEHFTWKLYTEKLLNLTALYGFWRYSVSQVGKKELVLYCRLLFQLFIKSRAEMLLP